MVKYTIITINYNNARNLRQTIESVINQTFRNFEYIIIDGGSQDDSVDIIKEYAEHIDYWVSEPDNGVYHAMNKGLQKAHGEYINFMNSGDSFFSNTVLDDVDLQIDDTDILFGNVCDPVSRVRYGGIKAGSEITFLTLKKEILCHQGTFYHHSIFDRHLYDETLKLIADWKVNVQAIVFDNCKVKIVDTMIANYDQTGMSSTQKQLHLVERQRVMSELFPERILKDYDRLYTDDEMPIVSLLPKLKRRGRLQTIAYLFVKYLLKLSGQ